jgi:hypothetical protein
VKVDLKNMTPTESRALAALLAALPARQKRAMSDAIHEALHKGHLFDTSKVKQDE